MKSFGVCLMVFTLIDLTYQWSYEDESKWPGVCQSGVRQSPINIQTREAVVDSKQELIQGELLFRGYSNVDVFALNNGHTLKWDLVPGGPAPILSGGPLRGNYTLRQFHLHWLSEHEINGLKYSAEIHLVHIKTGLDFDEAKKISDGLAVIGIMCQVKDTADRNHALEEIMGMVPDILDPSEGEPSVAEIIDINHFMSPNPQSYYTYEGSLTTPSCDEAVRWMVMDTPIAISSEQYKLLSKVHIGGVANYRSIQTTDRVVYRPAASCSSLLLPGYLSLISIIYHCSKVLFLKSWCKFWGIKNKIFGDYKNCPLVN